MHFKSDEVNILFVDICVLCSSSISKRKQILTKYLKTINENNDINIKVKDKYTNYSDYFQRNSFEIYYRDKLSLNPFIEISLFVSSSS